MANWRRLPGVLFSYRYQALLILLTISVLIYVANQSGIVCTNHAVDAAINQLCQKYASGLIVGTLCEPLCKNSQFSSITCTSSHNGKDLVFSAQWEKHNIHVKSTKRIEPNIPLTINEDDFKNAVLDLISSKLNFTITGEQLERLIHLLPKELDNEKRQYERQDIYNLLQSQEYLLSVLFHDRQLFPEIYGTCGYFYAVETIHPPKINSLYIWSNVWSTRLKYAIAMMDFLEQLETDFPDPLHLCDVKINHFGLSNEGRLKYLDLDQIYPDNVLQAITGGGQSCNADTDCDLFDCRAPCNLSTKRCETGTTNNNLQILCEKVFLGWTLSGKLMVPGLLMTVNTPPSLASLLRQCAENGRSSVPEDIRQRLYTTLTEIEQIVAEQNEA